jgi:hypothetical protein
MHTRHADQLVLVQRLPALTLPLLTMLLLLLLLLLCRMTLCFQQLMLCAYYSWL